MIATSSSFGLPSAALIDPRALMSIRNLELRARVIVEGFWSGMHRSPYHGFSVEFTEYRQYTQGDDPRFIDWRVYARSDRHVIKKFEDETNLRCHLLVDQSKSMGYSSGAYTKAQYAATLAATLAYFLHQQGDAIGLLTFDDRIREYLPARNRKIHLRQIMTALEKPSTGGGTNLATPIERITGLVRKRGLIVLASDFLAPLEKLESSLIALTASRHEVTVFQILDPAELTLQFDEAILFEDLESAKTLYIDPVAARKTYVSKLEAHCTALRNICNKLGIDYHRLSTEQPMETALFDYVQGRMRRGTVSRRSAPGRL